MLIIQGAWFDVYEIYMSENSIKSEREINKKNVTSGHYADVFLIYIIKHTRR